MNPFTQTRSVSFEASNFCNFAWFHTACPLNQGMETPYMMNDPATLPMSIVKNSLLILASHNWQGLIEFHQYSEPLQDPRLFVFIEWARKLLPESRIECVTNGYSLTPTLAKELREQGLTRLHISLYGGEDERKRRAAWLASEIEPLIPISIGWHELDNRLSIYSREPRECKEPCGAPLTNIVVTCHGRMGLCCFDWRESVTFGDLHHKPLDEIAMSMSVQEAYAALMRGERNFGICQRCDRARR